jgi:hypothetical protein
MKDVLGGIIGFYGPGSCFGFWVFGPKAWEKNCPKGKCLSMWHLTLPVLKESLWDLTTYPSFTA